MSRQGKPIPCWDLQCVICRIHFVGNTRYTKTCCARCRKALSRRRGLVLSDRPEPIFLGWKADRAEEAEIDSALRRLSREDGV